MRLLSRIATTTSVPTSSSASLVAQSAVLESRVTLGSQPRRNDSIDYCSIDSGPFNSFTQISLSTTAIPGDFGMTAPYGLMGNPTTGQSVFMVTRKRPYPFPDTNLF